MVETSRSKRVSSNKEKSNMTTINLATFAVRDSDGELDLSATVTKFEGALLAYQAERETELATIGAAVHAVFDAHKGTNINMPAVTSLALQKLNVQPETYKALSERVQSFVRDNAGERESGAIFGIAKGKGGGCCRWEDVPVKEPKAAK